MSLYVETGYWEAGYTEDDTEQVATPANSVSGSTSTASAATQGDVTFVATPLDSVSGSTSGASAATQSNVAVPANSIARSTSSASRAINLNLTLDLDFAEYPFDDVLVAGFSE